MIQFGRVYSFTFPLLTSSLQVQVITSSPTVSSSAPQVARNLNLCAIVGGIIGGLELIAALATGSCYIRRRLVDPTEGLDGCGATKNRETKAIRGIGK